MQINSFACSGIQLLHSPLVRSLPRFLYSLLIPWLVRLFKLLGLVTLLFAHLFLCSHIGLLAYQQAVSSFTELFTYSYTHSFARSPARSLLGLLIYLLSEQQLRAKQTTITLLPHHTTLWGSTLFYNRDLAVLGSRTLLPDGRINLRGRIEAGYLRWQGPHKLSGFSSATPVYLPQ